MFSPLRQVQKLSTNAGYILHIGKVEEVYYYAGLYEIGCFKIEQNKIQLITSMTQDHVSYGLVDGNNQIFYVCKGTNGLEAWGWKDKSPYLIWSKPELSVSKGLILAPNKTLLIGTYEGKILHIDLSGNVLSEFMFEEESVRHMILTDACVSLTNENFLYKFTIDGEKKLLWKTKLSSKSPNHSLAYINNKIWITTYLGEVIVVNNETGTIEKTYELIKENFSPITILQKHWLVYTSPEQVNCTLFDTDKKEEFSIPFSDKMVRALEPVKDGIIVGDDYGDITLLKRPQIEIRKLTNLKKLMEFDPT